MRFISESAQAEGAVVDWTQGRGRGRSDEPGAYYRIVEVVMPDGRRVRGETDIGVGLNQLEIGQRLILRFRSSDPARMRVASFPHLWLTELIAAMLAIAFAAAGVFLRTQARKERAGS